MLRELLKIASSAIALANAQKDNDSNDDDGASITNMGQDPAIWAIVLGIAGASIGAIGYSIYLCCKKNPESNADSERQPLLANARGRDSAHGSPDQGSSQPEASSEIEQDSAHISSDQGSSQSETSSETGQDSAHSSSDQGSSQSETSSETGQDSAHGPDQSPQQASAIAFLDNTLVNRSEAALSNNG